MDKKRARLEQLLARTETEISVELGARLRGYQTFVESVSLNEFEVSVLRDKISGHINNNDLLGLSGGDDNAVLHKILHAARTCKEETEKFLNSCSEQLYESVCVDFDLCNKLEKYNSEIDLAIALAASLEITFQKVPVPELTAYIIKKGVKSYCHC